jgi:glyoxylase-like metal-dependent hydrolase (beta-lactamase superfamily II)
VSSLRVVDLRHLGRPQSIASYLVETDDGLALGDCGPATTLPALEAGLAAHGVALEEIRHLLLSHIHLDHAGGAGTLVRRVPGLTVWVSPVGAPHVVAPERLERSARRLYGDDFDRLWGELLPVPEENVRLAEGDVLGWEAFPTPGHAVHHVSYLRDGTVLAGDSCGVRMPGSSYAAPVSPPPDIDVETWHASIAATRDRRPARLALTHFGIFDDVDRHLDSLERELDVWADAVGNGMDEDAFVELVARAAGESAEAIEAVAPVRPSWAGMKRYWDKRREAA